MWNRESSNCIKRERSIPSCLISKSWLLRRKRLMELLAHWSENPQEVARMAFQWIQLPLCHSCSWKQSKSPTCMKLVITGWNSSVPFLDCTAHCFLHLLWQFTEHNIIFMKKALKCKDEHKKPKKYYKYLMLQIVVKKLH